jgi:O-antigen ligase
VVGAIALAIFVGTAASWNARVATIGEYSTEGSALTRLLVWKWTLGYVATHPLGGSFDAYGLSTVIMPATAENPGGYVQNGRAWHSSYFEVLGELGWPGLVMFLLAAGSTLFSLIRLSRKCRKSPDLVWVADMSDAVQSGMLVFLSSGAFVSLAFQPPFWYFVSMGICLRAYVWHAERAADATEIQGWRHKAQTTRTAPVPGWQEPQTVRPSADPARPVPGWRDRARGPAR